MSRKHVNYEEDKIKVPMNKPYNIQNTNICNGIFHISFFKALLINEGETTRGANRIRGETTWIQWDRLVGSESGWWSDMSFCGLLLNKRYKNPTKRVGLVQSYSHWDYASNEIFGLYLDIWIQGLQENFARRNKTALEPRGQTKTSLELLISRISLIDLVMKLG